MGASLQAVVTEARDVLGLAAGLLRIGRRDRVIFHLVRNLPENVYAYNALVMLAEEAFRGIRGEHLAAETRARIVALLEEFSRTPEVIRAKSLALALDNALGHRLARSFRNQVFDLSPGDAVPISQPCLRDLFGSELSPHPHNSSDHPDRIPHLGLLPQDLGGLQVRLDARPADQSCPLLDPQHQILATGVPNRSEDEFRFERSGGRGPSVLFHYGPKDTVSQRERLVQLLRRASEAGASLLVLPELCADADCLSALATAFREGPETLRLLVAGSHHVRTSEQLRNECVALLRGYSRPLTHSKFAAYVLRRGPGRSEVREGLFPGHRSLTLFLSDDWSFTFLICKDLLDPDVDRLLKALGTSLLFVPALTPKTGQFETYTAALAHANQAIVVVVNNPIFAKGDPVHSIFSVPRRSGYQKIATLLDHPPPGVCCYRLSDGSLTWLDTGSKVD